MPDKEIPDNSMPSTDKYIAYPAALNLLKHRWGSTPEEIATWVFMGPEAGGIKAYTNAKELDPPPRFYFDPLDSSESDYLKQLAKCRFSENELHVFEPEDRYITGKELLVRWNKYFEGPALEGFIEEKVREDYLMDFHPLFGSTQASRPEETHLPPMEEGLYLKNQVEEVERIDFSTDLDKFEPEIGSKEWRIENAKRAANARHNKPGGSREKVAAIRSIWQSGKYSTRDLCAEEECAALDMPFSTARRALRNQPDPQRSS